MNTPITRVQVAQLPLGFTPTGDGYNRKYRRSKDYQEKMKEFLELRSKALSKLADQEVTTLANCTLDEEGKVIHNPLLTNDSTNTTTE